MADKLKSKNETRFVGVEPASCPSLTKGKYEYDFGDTAQMTPLLKMHTLGSGFVPSPIHAGGYVTMVWPSNFFLYHEKLMEAVAYEQNPVFQAGVDFARCEGNNSRPESTHAIKATMDEAVRAKKEGKKKSFFSTSPATGYWI